MNDMPGKTGIEFAFRRFISLFTLFIEIFSLVREKEKEKKRERLYNYYKMSSIVLYI